MNEHRLNAIQVATLLVSASYGIGFLFGSGEMALSRGMGASLYGLATALGMLLLAALATRLWRRGRAVWDLFGDAYGSRTQEAVALLSLLWMAGVLAAQIQGGAAVLRLLGMPSVWAFAVVLLAVFGVSRLTLGRASHVLGVFLALSAAVLVYALTDRQVAEIYLASPANFVTDLGRVESGSWFTILVAVTALVCTGADYHQFLLAASNPRAAVVGCMLAAVCLALMSPMPASVVIALQKSGYLDSLGDPKQAMPRALASSMHQWGPAAETALLLALSAAALGSAAAILRAMTGALAVAVRGRMLPGSKRCGLLVLLGGGWLAARGEGIIATMVAVNVIYIASVGIALCALILRHPLSPIQARSVMALGFAASVTARVAAGMRWPGELADGIALAFGLGFSALPLAYKAVQARPKASTGA